MDFTQVSAVEAIELSNQHRPHATLGLETQQALIDSVAGGSGTDTEHLPYTLAATLAGGGGNNTSRWWRCGNAISSGAVAGDGAVADVNAVDVITMAPRPMV